MGETFGCTCCCVADDEPEGLRDRNMESPHVQQKSVESGYFALDLEDTTYSGEYEESITKKPEPITNNTDEYKNVDSISITNEEKNKNNHNNNNNNQNENENEDDINQQKYDETITSTEYDHVLNTEKTQTQKQKHDENEGVGKEEMNEYTPDIINNQNIQIQNNINQTISDSDDDFEAALAKLGNIQHYEKQEIAQYEPIHAQNEYNPDLHANVHSNTGNETNKNENKQTQITENHMQTDNDDTDIDAELAKLDNIKNYDIHTNKPKNEKKSTVVDNDDIIQHYEAQQTAEPNQDTTKKDENTQFQLAIIDTDTSTDGDIDAELAKLDNIKHYNREPVPAQKENDPITAEAKSCSDDEDSLEAELAKLDTIQHYHPPIEINLAADTGVGTDDGYDTTEKHSDDSSIYSITGSDNECDLIDEKQQTIFIKVPSSNNNIVDSNKEKQLQQQQEIHSRSRLLLQKYKSQKEMLDDESIESLLQFKLSQHAFAVLGEQKLYDLPTEKEALFHLERDLRKIKLCLKDFRMSEQRKYAKIAVLKHVDLLTAVYKKYCKIGGDRYWLTYDGWISLLRDCNLIKMGDDNDKYYSVFRQTYSFHSSHQQRKNKKKGRHSTQLSGLYGGQSFHDKDPWTGIWCKEKDRQRIHRMEKKQREKEEREREMNKNKKFKKKTKRVSIKEKSQGYYDRYKLRKIGDYRVVGCMNDISYADIGGTFNKSNYKKAKLQIRFKKRKIQVYGQKRIWNCELFPPKSLVDNIIMKVKWNEINQKSSRNKDGTFKLYKHDELKDDDDDIGISQYVGLARYEFFDAMLELSTLLNANCNRGFLEEDEDADDDRKDLYETFDQLMVQYLDQYIYKNHVELERHMQGKDINEDPKMKLKAYNTILIKLFKKYASLDSDEIATKNQRNIDCDEWSAMAVELCKAAKSLEKSTWKLGGKPSMTEIIQCFVLSKNDTLLQDEEIGFQEWQRCLILFTNMIFKYHPKARYQIVAFEDKLDLVLKWCEKLEARKYAISSKSYHRSDTLKAIKRKKTMRNVALTLNSVHSARNYSGSPRTNFNASAPVDWNRVSNSF